MPLLNVRNHSKGFTLIETLVVIIIIGILSAVAAPSFLGMLNKAKVNDAVAKMRGALQEAQREAIRKSKNCTVTVPSGTDPTVTSPCFITGVRTLTGIRIRVNATSLGTITFNFQGRATTGGSDNQAIVLSLANDTSTQERCLMISSPLGLIRNGIYSDSLHNRTTVDPNNSSTDPNCATSQQ